MISSMLIRTLECQLQITLASGLKYTSTPELLHQHTERKLKRQEMKESLVILVVVTVGN